MKENIKVRLININEFDIEKETDFQISSEIFDELTKHVKFFDDRGLKFNISSIKIVNHNIFYQWVLKRLYPEYEIEDHQKNGIKGHPDFVLKKIPYEKFFEVYKEGINSEDYNHFKFEDRNVSKNEYLELPEEIFVEIKLNGDGLRGHQFEWMLNNRGKKQIRILFIKEDKTDY